MSTSTLVRAAGSCGGNGGGAGAALKPKGGVRGGETARDCDARIVDNEAAEPPPCKVLQFARPVRGVVEGRALAD